MARTEEEEHLRFVAFLEQFPRETRWDMVEEWHRSQPLEGDWWEGVFGAYGECSYEYHLEFGTVGSEEYWKEMAPESLLMAFMDNIMDMQTEDHAYYLPELDHPWWRTTGSDRAEALAEFEKETEDGEDRVREATPA